MNYAKHLSKQAKKQQRKQLVKEKQLQRQRATSAYNCRKQSGSGKFLMGSILLLGYIMNAHQVNTLLAGLF